MRVQRVVTPVTGAESWTLLDDQLDVVAPVERYLAHLVALERSPNTVRAYAHGLRWWWEFLALREVDWQAASLEDVAEFVRWLRMPADNVVMLHPGAAQRAEVTVNRHLAAVFGCYELPCPLRGPAGHQLGCLAHGAARLV